MHGRIKRSTSHRAMALFVLGCAYLAFAPLPALAQGAGGKGVSVTVNPTTGYTVINSQTIGTPRGTTVGPSGGVPSVTTRPGGGLSQSLPAGIEITGIRQNSQTLRGPMGVNINAGLSSLRNGAVRCVMSMRCTTALGIGLTGLELLLNENNAQLDEPSGVSTDGPFPTDPSQYNQWDASMSCSRTSGIVGPGTSQSSLCDTRGFDIRMRWINQGNQWRGCFDASQNPNTFKADGPNEGLYRCEQNPDIDRPRVVLSPSEISDMFNDYQPTPNDWNWLTGGLDFSAPDVTIEITDIPVLDGSNEPNFITAADGTSRGTYNTYTPTVVGNDTSKPEIEVEDQQTETSYDEQGNPTGSSTSTGTMTPNPGGSASSPDIVIPTDCDFMPTVCRFIDWFAEPDTQPDPDQEIRDLVQVYEDGGRQVSVGSETGSCPPPRTIELSLVPSVEFSFQPFCDLATAVRFWLLAIASFGAAYMTVRSI